MVDELQVGSGGGANLDVGALAGLGNEHSVDDFVPSGVTDASVTAPLPAAQAAGDGEPVKLDTPQDEQTLKGATVTQPGAQPVLNVDEGTKITQAGDNPVDAAAPVKTDAGVDPAKAAGEQIVGDASLTITTDPDLSPEENSVVQALDENERPAAVESFKRGKQFMTFYLDSSTPAEDVRSHLEARSPSRYAEVRDAVLNKSLSDPNSFARDYYQRDPDGYGKFIAAVMKGDTSGFFARQLTGRSDVTSEQIQTALSFYDANNDRVPADGATGLLTQDEIDAVAAEFPDLSDKLKSALTAPVPAVKQELPADVTERLERLRQIEEGEKTKTDAGAANAAVTAAAQAEAQRDAIYDQSYGVVNSYIERKLDDAQDGLGLKVTDAERQAMPDVANLKDIKRNLLLKGFGDLKEFEDGLGHWGEKDDQFMAVGKELGVFSGKGEKQNALLQAGKLVPFADKYLGERLNHPIIAWLDKQITAAIERGGTAPPLETLVTGGTTALTGQATAQDFEKRLDDFEPGRK